MGYSTVLAFAILVSVLAFFMPSSYAEIKHTPINADSRSVIEFEKFGFTNNGHLDIILTNISYSAGISNSEELSLMGFFLITEENWVQVLIEYSKLGESEASCVLQNPLIKPLFTFQEIDQPSRMVNNPLLHQVQMNITSSLPIVCLQFKFG